MVVWPNMFAAPTVENPVMTPLSIAVQASGVPIWSFAFAVAGTVEPPPPKFAKSIRPSACSLLSGTHVFPLSAMISVPSHGAAVSKVMCRPRLHCRSPGSLAPAPESSVSEQLHWHMLALAPGLSIPLHDP